MPYIDPSIVAQAKRIDLLAYLQEREPDELVKIGHNTYATKTHDSLKISNGKWYWWSQGFGGRSALDYLVKVRGMGFIEAVECLAGHCFAPMPTRASSEKPNPDPKPFKPPKKHDDSSKATSYLMARGIAPNIVEECIRAGVVYEHRRGNLSNVTFVGFDSAGEPRCAALRGIGHAFKGEAAGSDKRHPFILRAKTENFFVHVFESPIDTLSYATLLHERGIDWRKENLLSLDGIPPISAKVDSLPPALTQYLADKPNTALVRLCLDDDEPGRAAASRIATALRGRCDVSIMIPHRGKDWNEYLMAKNGLRPFKEASPAVKSQPKRTHVSQERD